MTLKVVDRFTTQHGSWDVNPSKPYGIDQAHRDKYEAGRLIPGAGADHHIFVKSDIGNFVEFNTAAGNQYKAFHIPVEGWLNFPIYGDGWIVRVNNIEVARDIGLPGGEHVSTFLIVEDVDSGSQPQPPQGEWKTVTIHGTRFWIADQDGNVIFEVGENE
jgi:hypothetical protein